MTMVKLLTMFDIDWKQFKSYRGEEESLDGDEVIEAFCKAEYTLDNLSVLYEIAKNGTHFMKKLFEKVLLVLPDDLRLWVEMQ